MLETVKEKNDPNSLAGLISGAPCTHCLVITSYTIRKGCGGTRVPQIADHGGHGRGRPPSTLSLSSSLSADNEQSSTSRPLARGYTCILLLPAARAHAAGTILKHPLSVL